MTQLLLALEDKQLGRALQSFVSQKYELEVLTFTDSVKVLSMLELLPDIKLVICSEKFSQKICEFLIKNHENFDHDVKVLILGNKKTIYPHASSISATLPPPNMVHHIGYLIGKEDASEAEVVEDESDKTTVFKMPELVTIEEPKEEAAPAPIDEPKVVIEYVPISMRYFIHLPKTKIAFDVYSRVKKDEDFNYNVKIAAGSEISKTEIDRIIVRGGKDLYVTKADYALANEFFSTHFLNRFKNSSLSVADRMLLNSESYEILLDVFKDSSFTKYSIEIIKELIKSIDILLNSPSPIEAFFNGLKQQKNLAYGYYHSYLTGLLIFKIIENFSWKKDQSKNKILYLALFHDLALHNNRLIESHHNYAREFNKLSEAEKQILNNHADASATILEKIVKAPKELTLLIREHHGLKQGVGFTEALSLGIGPLSMAYIVTEDFVTSYLSLWKTSDKEIVHEFIKTYPEELFKGLMAKYDRLTYADVVAELQKLIKGLQ